MPPPSVGNWPVLPELAAFRTATFNQRCILFTHFREDPRLSVGACPGLSAEWITMHALWPNQKPADRMTAMDKLSVWQDAAAYAGAFNSTRGGYA
ncbi:MAG: hypothetical protein JWR10_1432 [Rubritepida sp.]|nr:hypothetical protein [Rubritepida sp.]